MKIAILTLPFHTNYGGIIQNYALQQFVLNLGHDVYTIDIRPRKIKLAFYKIPYSYIKRLIKRLLGDKNSIVFLEQRLNRDQLIIERNIRNFINNNIRLTNKICKKSDLLKINKQFDILIIGSDQVWRIPYAKPSIETYFGDFIKNCKIKRMAYSASFGTDEIEYSEEQQKKCKELISNFDLVTTREDSGLNLINRVYKWKLKRPAIQTIDPTMLLSKEEYRILYNSKSKGSNNKNGLFYYVLDMTYEKQKIINKIADKLGIIPFTVNCKSKKWQDSIENRIMPPVEDWLEAFDDASYVFTDSFHGTVFSIIYNKNFITFGNAQRGNSRFDSLFRLFSIKDKIIFNESDLIKINIYKNLDWIKINSIIDSEKKKTIKLLNQIIK